MYPAFIRGDRCGVVPKLLCNLFFTRSMARGPRTFSEDVNKWRWKRYHQKRAIDKGRRLLEQERQVYEARLQSEVRAKLMEESELLEPRNESSSGTPMGARGHLKALADRFSKEGAEDLWNEDDGSFGSAPPKIPFEIGTPNPRRGIQSRVGSRTMLSDGRRFVAHSFVSSGSSRVRRYSVQPPWWFAKRTTSRASLGEYECVPTRMPDADEIRGSEEEDILYSERRFDECNISPPIIKALTAAGYVQMMRVQEATLPVLLEGKDAVVKAKTGTGKSAAFLLPAIEAVLKASSSYTIQRVPPIYALVICPNRELASQLAAEANAMLKYHEGIGVLTLSAGTPVEVDLQRLENNPCQIVIACPGRFLDHVDRHCNFSARLMGLKMLVIDEADHLLSHGRQADVEKIIDCLPRQRQSLLFSATIPMEVRRMSLLVLKREHAFIDTVGLGIETPVKVNQCYLVAPQELQFHMVYHLLKDHRSKLPDYKVIVFCMTKRLASLLFFVLKGMAMNVRELHSWVPSDDRAKACEEFKDSKALILITSDVSARGVDYPDVTLVLQVNIPLARELYIHRLGRTGRKGKSGECILLLVPWEEHFLSEIRDLPMKKLPLPVLDSMAKDELDEAMRRVNTGIKERACVAWLGYYANILMLGKDKTRLVENAMRFRGSVGLKGPCRLSSRTARVLGVEGLPGVKIRQPGGDRRVVRRY